VTLERFGARLARVEPAVRTAFAIDPREPAVAHTALYWAIEHDCVRRRHFEAVWDRNGATLREMVINAAPQRRVDRLERERSGRPEPWVYKPVYNTVELLSYRPEETPSEWTLGHVECFARLPLGWLPRLYQLSASREQIQDHVLGLLMMRILVTPDALELRRDLWDGAPPA
jgi:hypothetical protein